MGSVPLSFLSLLKNRWAVNNTLLCIGLDPDLDLMPPHITQSSRSVEAKIFAFSQEIIDATAEFVCAFKIQAAFYEALGIAGWIALKQTIDYLHDAYPMIPVILDAKRADIGSTSTAYTKAVFDMLRADAVTVNPYLGHDALMPFLKRTDKGIIILVKTSNPGSLDFQDQLLLHEGKQIPLTHLVMQTIVNSWNKSGNCLAVVGGTYPEELLALRKIAGDLPFLIPGIGAQGGEIAAVIKAGRDSQGQGMIISASRAIIYASSGRDFASAARTQAQTLCAQINKHR